MAVSNQRPSLLPKGASIVPLPATKLRDAAPSRKSNNKGIKVDRKGKGKARNQDAPEADEIYEVETWMKRDAFVNQSFNVFRLGPLHNFPFTPSTQTVSNCGTLSKALRSFLDRHPILDEDDFGAAHDRTFKTVQAGFIESDMFSEEKEERSMSLLPLLIKLVREAEDDDDSMEGETSTFILLPGVSDWGGYSVLLAKSSPASLTKTFINFLQTLYDTQVNALVIPPPSMILLLEQLVRGRSDSAVTESSTLLPTSLTFTFPASVAKAGLSTLTLTLPPALIDSLTESNDSNSFLSHLSQHIHNITSFSLEQLYLVRLGAGRGTFVHSGVGTELGGAKVKLYKNVLGDEGSEVDVVMSLISKIVCL